MSLLLGSLEPIYLNDGETESPFLSEDKNGDYNFKYVPADRFKYIVKDVRRQRCQEEEESVWASFVKQQELAYNKNSIQPSVQSIKELLDQGMKEADKELKRLEADILSDRIEKGDRTGNSQKKKSKVNNIRDLPPKKVPIMKESGTDSTNLLLTIPEERNACKKKSDLENFKLYARKSCSSHAIVQNRQSSKRLLHVTNGVEYNSSPDISTHRDATADGVIHTRPDPFIMHRILTMQRKVCELLDEIAFRLGNIPAPDGIKDMQKRQQCVTEFVVRFSRNYLYDLERYVKDIRRHMCVISPRARIKPNHRSLGLHMHAVEHKLLAAHQLLLHALVAYCKHIPSSILKGHPGKFREILQVVVDLKTMCDRLHLNTNYLDSGDTDILPLGKDIESKCNAILSKLKLHSDNDLPLNSNKIPSVMSLTPHSTSNKKHVNHKQLFNRLSMYTMGTKMAKNSLKQKTNYYRQKDRRYDSTDRRIHRVSNESISIDQPCSSPVTITSSKDASPPAMRKNRTYAKDEDIKTMMDTLPIDSDSASNFESQEKHDMILMKRRPKELKKYSNKMQDLEQFETLKKIVKGASTNDDDLVKRVTTVREEHLSNLVPVIADLMSFVSNKRNGSEIRPVSMATVKTLMEFLQQYHCPKSTNTNHHICNSKDNSYNHEHLKKSKVSSETHKNAENMRLIYVSSMENMSKISRYCDASCQANCESLTEAFNFEMKVNEERRTMDSLSNIDLVVSEETEMNFLRYRREYQHLTQSIPMYSSNTQNKPWDIVAWISDKLVDELITEIATELQIDDVIQKLYELEFQEF